MNSGERGEVEIEMSTETVVGIEKSNEADYLRSAYREIILLVSQNRRLSRETSRLPPIPLWYWNLPTP